ncbi:MAG: Gfo/Idh/MocA family oxidoreductase [Planctomycetota bacterium]|nr:Gfo/Idh/MocA family oxidoreductase [Planctomycetota bacterium]
MSEENDSGQAGAGGVGRRNFIGSTALGLGGAASGISFFFHKDKKHPDAAAVKGWNNTLFGGGDKVRTGHIGVGNRGGSLLRTALQVPGSMPIAVCDKSAKKLSDNKKGIQEAIGKREGLAKKEWAKKIKVDTSDDYRRVLDNKDVEAVFIATPHYLHGPMAIDAVEAGKHVYCEKAMAFTIGENQDIVDLVEGGAKSSAGNDIVFQVGHQRHYSPLYQKVADMIAEDTIGEVATIRAQWNQNDKISRPAPSRALERIVNWRLYSEYSGGLTTEFATHQIDVANWFFGPAGNDHVGIAPHSVRGYGGVDWYYQDARDTHDNVHLIFTYKVPVVQRDPFGRKKKDGSGKDVFEKDGQGNVRHREVTFDYMCTMANAHIGPSEMMLGRYGTIQVSLAGGEFWKEKKSREDLNRIAEGTNPRRALQKKILKSGATMAKLGGKDADEVLKENPLAHGEKHWSHFIEPIQGAYDKIETLLAVESFHKCVRLAKAGEPFKNELRANARVGMNSAIAALMANIAMREDRTVKWDEFSRESS